MTSVDRACTGWGARPVLWAGIFPAASAALDALEAPANAPALTLWEKKLFGAHSGSGLVGGPERGCPFQPF